MLIGLVFHWVVLVMQANHEDQMPLDYGEEEFDGKSIKRVGPVQLHEGKGKAWGWWCVTNDMTKDCSFHQYKPAAEIVFSRESQPYEKAEAV